MKKVTKLILIVFVTISGCKKQTQKLSATYHIDSISIKNYDTLNALFTSSTIVNIGSQQFLASLNGVAEYRSNGDSVVFYNSISNSCTGENILSYLNVIFTQRPDYLYFNIYGGCASLNHYYSWKYNYNAAHNLSNIDYFFIDQNQTIGIVETQRTWNPVYNDNNIHHILKNEKSYMYGHFDSIITTDQDQFEYTSIYANPTDLTGLDINDFVFENYIYYYTRQIPAASPSMNIISSFILNGIYSYGINCRNLIEHMHLTGAVPNDINISYSFDISHENRVQQMTITNSANEIPKSVCTFYYRE